MGLFDKFFAPPSEAKFAAMLIAAFRRAGDPLTYTYDAAERRLIGSQDGKQESTINLANLYGSFSTVPRAERAEFVKKVAVGFVSAAVADLPDDFDDVRPDLLPMIRTRAMMEFVQLMAEDPADMKASVSIPVSDELLVCLVYDLPHTMRFITEDDLAQWSITPYEALEAARRNLNERPPESYGAIDDRLYIFQSGDAYDATRMLSLDLMHKLKLDGHPVALPITRDCLLVTGSDDREGLRMMAECAELEVENPRPMCAVPHILISDEWRTWKLPEGHPSVPAYRQLQLRYRHAEYAEQQKLLNQLTQAKGLDVFVASFSVFENEGDGSVWSVSQWTKGVPTWLPEAERVAFLDPDSDRTWFAPWDTVMTALSDRMTRLEHWPPRWSVDRFPNAEQLDAIATDL